jgi:ferredoxin-like protein FixX
MTDIATRYMRLVEKRPELAARFERGAVRIEEHKGVVWWLVDTGGDFDLMYQTDHEDIPKAIFTKLVVDLPDGVYVWRRDGRFFVGDPVECGTCNAGSYIEALLAFWEGQA